MTTGGLVDALSHRIDSIRKAVDDEEDEDDSGYVDEWEEGTDLWTPEVAFCPNLKFKIHHDIFLFEKS